MQTYVESTNCACICHNPNIKQGGTWSKVPQQGIYEYTLPCAHKWSEVTPLIWQCSLCNESLKV